MMQDIWACLNVFFLTKDSSSEEKGLPEEKNKGSVCACNLFCHFHRFLKDKEVYGKKGFPSPPSRGISVFQKQENPYEPRKI